MKDNRIAVIGMSFKYPHIDSMGELVKYLEAGEFVPADGWKDRGALLHVPEYDKVSGLAPMMTGIEYFDSRFFKTVQKETLEMSPEMKLALTHSVLAVYDSGYSLADIREHECGMVLACSSTAADYRELTPEGSTTAYLDTRETMVGCRLSYYFGFRGPFFALDSTCSSSLLSVKQACDAIISGDADMMLAGGVQLFLPRNAKRAHELFLGTEAVKDKYIPFDEKAVNLKNGEGAGFIMLKRYDEAVRDNDNIYGIISGCGICGTRAEGRISPYATDGVSQCRAIHRAWEKAGVTADDITEIEAHGSATDVGDESEVKGLALALNDRKNTEKVILTSVKSNIGHTSQCAGISGVIKTLTGFVNDTAYPIANFTEPKRSLDFEGAHLLPIGEPVRFAPGKRRVAGVSGYGLNSLNVHVIVENSAKYVPDSRDADELNRVLKLSAITETSFRAYVEKVKQAAAEVSDINDFIYTLNRGRDDFGIRAAVYFENRQQLLDELEKVKGTSFGEVNEKVTISGDAPAKAAFEAICAGKTVDFADYYKNSSYRRIHTVPYQFDKLYSWIVDKEDIAPETVDTAGNISTETIDVRSEMMKIWQSVLETEEEIADEDTFFELGGNSMLASVLIESVNDRFGSELEFGDIYTYSAFGEMCGHIKETSAPETEDVPVSETIDVRSEMMKIWQSVLETEEEIADEDTFFELGGNSMLASVLIESVNDRFGSELEFGDIYTYSAFGEMCGHIEESAY